MKSKLLILVSVVFALATFSSCTKNPEKVLPKKDGKWTATFTITETTTNLSTTEVDQMVFTSGSGTSTDPAGSIDNFTWSYDKSGKKITLVFSGTVYIFDVTEAKTKSETWDLVTVDGATSSVTHSKMHVELKRN